MTRELPLPSMQELMAEVVLENPEIREELEELMMMLITDMKQVMRAGYRPHILPLQKAILPGLLRALQTTSSKAQESAERDAFERMMEAMRGTINTTDSPVTGTDD